MAVIFRSIGKLRGTCWYYDMHVPSTTSSLHLHAPPQAFERQVDALSRQLAKGEADVEEATREREVLLEELRAAQQVGRAQGHC